jgi:hypothetical protein
MSQDADKFVIDQLAATNGRLFQPLDLLFGDDFKGGSGDE